LVSGLKSLKAKAFLEKLPVSIQAVYSSIQPLNSAVQAYFIFNGSEQPYTQFIMGGLSAWLLIH
jgi:hypothetical protein